MLNAEPAGQRAFKRDRKCRGKGNMGNGDQKKNVKGNSKHITPFRVV